MFSLGVAMNVAFEGTQAATVRLEEVSMHIMVFVASAECMDTRSKRAPNNWRQLKSLRRLQHKWLIVWKWAAVLSKYAVLTRTTGMLT